MSSIGPSHLTSGSMASQHENQNSGTKRLEKILEWYPDVPPAVETLVHLLIQKQAIRHPESQAVCSWDGDLTYAELDELSSRLSGYLVTQGVTSEVIVPLCFEKSLWAIVSVLAVLKAGGVFLLLDPAQPIARLKSIVEQTGAKFALSSAACFEPCQALVQKASVVDSATFLELGNYLPSSLTTPSNAAYLIFTSGSTGTPKGVVLEHSQLSTTATKVGERLGYGTTSRVFQFASYAFDACITDIFATLVHGATLCIPSDWERNNGIVDALRRMRVTSAKFTPSLVSNLVFENVPTLTTVVLGGESPPASLVEELASKFKLLIVYGPTECCVICFISDANHDKLVPGEIGRPSGARGWIVNQNNYNELAEIGEIGELLIEGPQVGRGYLKDKVKTDAQYIKNPAWALTSGMSLRLYRTGDLARYMEDGTVCYVGRLDNQVKIRGQRLELEEVEKALSTCLSQLASVEAKYIVVDAVGFAGLTSKQLVAFLSLNTPDSLGFLDWEQDDKPALRTSDEEQERFAEIVEKLEVAMKLLMPAAAIPSIWIPLKTIPFTVSRKTDRKRLRNIVSPLSVKQLSTFTKPNLTNGTNGSHVPTSDKESKFCELWADVFRVPVTTIERNDNFFSLGGDSVMAIKLIAAARATGLDLSLDIVFRSPVLHQMADVTKALTIREEDEIDALPFSQLNDTCNVQQFRREASKRCRVEENSIEDIYPCSPMSEGLIALSMKDPGTYVLQFVYQMPDSVDINKLKAAWEMVSEHTQLLRTRFFDYNAELLQVVIDEPLNWSVLDEDLVSYLAAEKARRVDLGERMSRLAVVKNTDSGDKFLVWTIHHALVDGWSESDVISLVEQEYLGHPSNLSATPKFNRFIRHIRQQDVETARSFWQEQLTRSPIPVFPPLPDPSYVPKVQRSNRILHHLDEHADAELEHKISIFKRGSATPATMIQAAWFILVGIYSNSTDVVTGVTLNGRTARLPGIESIPGPTVTTIPFRAQFSPDQTILSFLEMIQNQYLDILPFAQFGLQNIRRLSEGAVNACKFRSLLVVQSANKPQSERQVLLGRSYSFPVMDFAIVMECELLDGTIDFRATFDHAVLSEEQIQTMFQQMENILHKISAAGSDTKVAELQVLSNEEMLRIAEWSRLNQSREPPQPTKDMRKSSEPPSTEMEQRLYDLWKTLLETDEFGIDGNFFQLGGGSILAMRLVSLARSQNLILTVAEVFREPTLEKMALLMRENVESEDVPPFSLVRNFDVKVLCKEAARQCGVSVEDIEDIYPCSEMQLHYVTGYEEAQQDIHGPWHWQSQAVYSLPRSVDVDKFMATWNDLIRRHQALRTRVLYTSGNVLQVVLKEPDTFVWKRATNLEEYLQQDRADYMKFGDRLLRLSIVDDQKKRYFVMAIHHMIYDGFSRTMLFQELEQGYLTGVLSDPQAKMNKFIKYITETDKDQATEFWTRYLAGANTKPLLSIPEIHPRFNPIEKTITSDRPALHGTECTLPTMIEVAGSLVLSHHLDCQDIILYSDRAGRNLPVDGIQDLIGPTTLFHPVRIHIQPQQKIAHLLRESQKAQREMMPHEHLGWLELRTMPHLKNVLKNSLNMNINPQPMASLGKKLGMEHKSSYASCDDPFGINIDLYEGSMNWTIYFDEKLISVEKVDRLLGDFEMVFERLVHEWKQPDMKVEDVLSFLRDGVVE